LPVFSPLTRPSLSSSPLCIEDLDLSDRNFKPCPCGYQVRHPPGPSRPLPFSHD
ncbi:hypothetical protein IMZ48_44270, partial [Candidatus Bathyarchaeota archaeon]|nr:hypothetical protein [Candidatus Bathyarchaeota archaeon]